MNGLLDAKALWEEWCTDTPWYLEVIERVEEDYAVPLISSMRVGYKPGWVYRAVVLRYGSQDGAVILEAQVADVEQAVRALVEGVQLSVAEAIVDQGGYGWREAAAWAWRSWLAARLGR